MIKVAQIMDDEYNSVVINKGSEHGIRIDQTFLLYEIGEEIFDPDTKESLGKVEIVKGTGKVTHVQDKISTVTSDEYYYEVEKAALSPFSSAFERPKEKKVKIRKPFKNPKVGDIAKRI
ncbi:hypothetical protein [Sporosarcina sp. P17b]|uniref:hypothetical protein n=1 Tax=Sporosarcina sp. P17b TaxID=2048260 RepID=UPI000C17284F|nr:hypothetical protein [Sporosarcina sp. P17b]PIC72515.1 hypothetical protein CSV76_14895 [Sporosarcina sp. P17b]